LTGWTHTLTGCQCAAWWRARRQALGGSGFSLLADRRRGAAIDAVERRPRRVTIRILIADDHEVVRQGLRTFIESDPS